MAHDGEIIIDVDVLTKKAEQHLKELRDIGADTGDEISERMKYNARQIAEEYEMLSQKFSEVFNDIQDLASEIENIQFNIDMEMAKPIEERDIEAVRLMKDDLYNAKQEMAGLQSESSKLTKSLDLNQVKASELTSKSKQTTVAMKDTAKASHNISGGINKGIKSLSRYALALFGFRSIYQTLKSLANDWLNSDDLAARQMKANLEGIKNILSNALAPIIIWIGELMTTIVGYVAAFLKLFFGVDLASKKAGKNIKKGIGGGLKQANKEAKELQSILAGFDKADVVSIQKDMGGGSGGGGGGVGGLGELDMKLPDTSKFEKFLDKLKKTFDEVWNSATMQSFFDSFKRIALNTFDLVASVGANVWDNVLLSWNEMAPFLWEGFGNMVEYWRRVFEDMADITDEWFPVIANSINSFVDNIFATFRPLTTFIAQVWRDFTAIMLELWNTYGYPILDEIAKFIDGMINLFNRIWTDIVDPILSPVIEYMKWAWDSYVKDILLLLGQMIGEFILVAMKFINNFVMPIVNALVSIFRPIIELVMGIVSRTAKIAFSIFGESAKFAIQLVVGLLKGLNVFLDSEFVKGFVGGITTLVNKVSGLFNWLVNGVKTPLNIIIRMINTFIRGLNRIKVPSFIPVIGGKGVNVQEIPQLAKGGVLREPTLNIAGEYAGARKNPEIVTPQDIMYDTMMKALEQRGAGGNDNMTITIPLVVDGRTLAEVTKKVDKRDNLQRNGRLATT